MENVQIHEGIQEDECCSSHWSRGKDYLETHPLNSVVEAKHSHVYVQTAEDFEDDVTDWINTSVAAVVAAAYADPGTKYLCGLVFDQECP